MVIAAVRAAMARVSQKRVVEGWMVECARILGFGAWAPTSAVEQQRAS